MVAVTAAIGVTGFLGTMAVLWGTQANDLRTTTDEFASTSFDRRATIATQVEQLDALDATLDDNLGTITTLANSKAQSQDHQFFYDDLALAFKDCADERTEVLFYVERRSQYYVWQIQAYDTVVALYCSEVAISMAETLAEDDA